MNKRNYIRREHYSLRKLTIGVCSVLISTSLFGFTNTVHADTNTVLASQTEETSHSSANTPDASAKDGNQNSSNTASPVNKAKTNNENQLKPESSKQPTAKEQIQQAAPEAKGTAEHSDSKTDSADEKDGISASKDSTKAKADNKAVVAGNNDKNNVEPAKLDAKSNQNSNTKQDSSQKQTLDVSSLKPENIKDLADEKDQQPNDSTLEDLQKAFRQCQHNASKTITQTIYIHNLNGIITPITQTGSFMVGGYVQQVIGNNGTPAYTVSAIYAGRVNSGHLKLFNNITKQDADENKVKKAIKEFSNLFPNYTLTLPIYNITTPKGYSAYYTINYYTVNTDGTKKYQIKNPSLQDSSPIPQYTVNLNSLNQEINVYFEKPVTIKVVDEDNNNQELTHKTVQGIVNGENSSDINFDNSDNSNENMRNIIQNYLKKYVWDGVSEGNSSTKLTNIHAYKDINFGKFNTSNQSWTIYLKHAIDTIDSKHPGHGYSASDLQKTVTTDIKYVDDSNSEAEMNDMPEIKETVVFNGSGKYDKVTGKLVTVSADGKLSPAAGLTWTYKVTGVSGIANGNGSSVTLPAIAAKTLPAGYVYKKVDGTNSDLIIDQNDGSFSTQIITTSTGNAILAVHFNKKGTPAPQPTPKPNPNPQPTPNPNPTPKPQPNPNPTPIPQPQPNPNPTPKTNPTPKPTPKPQPTQAKPKKSQVKQPAKNKPKAKPTPKSKPISKPSSKTKATPKLSPNSNKPKAFSSNRVPHSHSNPTGTNQNVMPHGENNLTGQNQNIMPHSQNNPTAQNVMPHNQNNPEPGQVGSDIAPNGQDLPEGTYIGHNGTIVNKAGEIIGYIDKNGKPHVTLPQTGENKYSTLATAVLGAVVFAIGLLGLANTKKKRN